MNLLQQCRRSARHYCKYSTRYLSDLTWTAHTGRLGIHEVDETPCCLTVRQIVRSLGYGLILHCQCPEISSVMLQLNADELTDGRPAPFRSAAVAVQTMQVWFVWREPRVTVRCCIVSMEVSGLWTLVVMVDCVTVTVDCVTAVAQRRWRMQVGTQRSLSTDADYSHVGLEMQANQWHKQEVHQC